MEVSPFQIVEIERASFQALPKNCQQAFLERYKMLMFDARVFLNSVFYSLHFDKVLI